VDWLNNFLAPIREMDATGPIAVQIGTTNPRIIPKCLFGFGGFLSDNLESGNCTCTKATGTYFPCRLCWCPKEEMHFAGVGEYPLRESCMLEPLLPPNILGVYGKSVKYASKTAHKHKFPISALEKQILAQLSANSMLPVRPALYDVPTPFDEFSKYALAPPDTLHTLLYLLKKWYFDTQVMMALFAVRDPAYVSNMGILDDLMANQITKHSMPWKLKNWPRGISQFCKSISKSGATSLSQGGLGRLDMQ